MELKRPVFDPNHKHVLVFRHGPRAAVPPVGNVWDYYMPVDFVKGPQVAKRTREQLLPGVMPVQLRCSQIPRSSQTLYYLWPELVAKIRLDKRLGCEFDEIGRWAPIDAFPDAYNMTPQRQFEIQPDVVMDAGAGVLIASFHLAREIGAGEVGAMCSHMPFADVCAREARKLLGITENDSWLPEGFGSGAFVHLELDLTESLVACDYYPVPA